MSKTNYKTITTAQRSHTLRRLPLRKGPSDDKRIFWYLVVATIPAGLFGLVLEKKAETTFRSLLLIGIMMIVMGLILYLADKKPRIRKMGSMTLADALWIGFAQALAIIPGVSRSGSTMTAARFLALTREDAARLKLRHLTNVPGSKT